MADLQNYVDTTIEPGNDFEPIPNGWYLAQIIDSEMKPPASGDGMMLVLKWEILDGNYKGRILFDNLCLQHTNPQTVKLAQKALAGIRHATGVLQPKDSVELHNIPVMVKVVVYKDKRDEMKNDIRDYKKREPAGQAPQANNNAKPWQRG